MYLDDFTATYNPHYLGRGAVYFGPPLRPDGSVNMSAYGRRWGNNWPAAVAGQLHVPPGRFVGNARSLSIQPEVRRLETSAWDERGNMLVESVQASIVLYGHGAQNLADAMHAHVSRASSQPATDVVNTGQASFDAGSMLFTRHMIDTQQPIIVTPSWTSWSEGADWQRRHFGIELMSGVSCPVGSAIEIRYTPEGSATVMEGLVNPGLELGLTYAGVNRVDQRPASAWCYRCAPAIESALQTISDAAGTITLQFTLKPVRLPGASTAWYRLRRGQYPMTH